MQILAEKLKHIYIINLKHIHLLLTIRQLKKTIMNAKIKLNSTIILILLFTFISRTQAQTDSVLQAFTKSYELEAKAEYMNAIHVLKPLYDSTSYEMNLRLGWLHYEAGLQLESATYYQKSIDLVPGSIEAKLGIAYPLSVLRNWDKVLEQYTYILTLDPVNTIVFYRMGYIYYNKKDYQNANLYFEKVVNLYPFGYEALLMYAWTNYQLGKTPEAKVLFNKVLMLSPSDKSALEGLGLIK